MISVYPSCRQCKAGYRSVMRKLLDHKVRLYVRKNYREWLASIFRHQLEKRGYKIFRISAGPYPSETSKCRNRLAQFCTGYGLDLGFGGDPITDTAIRVDQIYPYSNVGSFPVQLGGDARRLVWFNDEVLDFVYSSHLLEDFVDTKDV